MNIRLGRQISRWIKNGAQKPQKDRISSSKPRVIPRNRSSVKGKVDRRRPKAAASCICWCDCQKTFNLSNGKSRERFCPVCNVACQLRTFVCDERNCQGCKDCEEGSADHVEKGATHLKAGHSMVNASLFWLSHYRECAQICWEGDFKTGTEMQRAIPSVWC